MSADADRIRGTGATDWVYRQPFDTDPATTLAGLRQRIFEERDYCWFWGDPRPATTARDASGAFAEAAFRGFTGY